MKLLNHTILWGFALSSLLFSCKSGSTDTPEPIASGPTPIDWTKPAHFPDPVYDISKNPLTEEGVELGRFLFYDGILSRNGLIGCGTCHQQAAAFTHHGHELSHGIDDRIGVRNALPIQNMAWNTSFFWDGGVHNLDLFPPAPIQNPVEMDETFDNVLQKLRDTDKAGTTSRVNYPQMFEKAFGTKEITSERMLKAMSQFMVSMVSATSPYDYYLQGDQAALNSLQKEGLSIFKQKCAGCHSGTLLTDYSFRNNGLPPNKINDIGRADITLLDEDKYKFKVPSLRNVALTGPYMHDGRFSTLEEVLDYYDNNQKSSKLAVVELSPTLDSLLKLDPARAGIRISSTEKAALLAFLTSLTDEQFTKDIRFADPGIGNAF
ncbi:cytochrome c peroxidase [Dyadobacter jejuensis]|uniref:Cytochrome c peroxidase n=1 Tax=Dyadobacter jejuensis TaxID=1082580 RepID=A0A316AJ52_9BACT|nr:cytochrome c peroxidase [Dyadobacter jejuensis]PWJ57661.1 cytochrome c peroxidase [Dyadobacter jejuensis]